MLNSKLTHLLVFPIPFIALGKVKQLCRVEGWLVLLKSIYSRHTSVFKALEPGGIQ